MGWVLPALVVLALVGSLLGWNEKLERRFPRLARASRTEWEELQDVRVEALEGLPDDVEIEAHAHDFDPERGGAVRAALVRVLSRRPTLRDDLRAMLAHARLDYAWRTVTVLPDLDRAIARDLAGETNVAIRRLADAMRDAPHTKLQHFYQWGTPAEQTLVAARRLREIGVDCRDGVRALVDAAALYPLSGLNRPFLRDARAWLDSGIR